MSQKKNKEDENKFEPFDQEQQKPKENEPCPFCKQNQAKADEYKDLLQRSVAEFDNYRKRSLKMMQEAKTDGELNVIMRFLPALDAFAKAKKMITDENILKGIEMIEKDIRDSFSQIGVKDTNPLGNMFDPNKHNAISVSHNPEVDDDVITEVYQQGYTYNDKIIRYAQVIINKK